MYNPCGIMFVCWEWRTGVTHTPGLVGYTSSVVYLSYTSARGMYILCCTSSVVYLLCTALGVYIICCMLVIHTSQGVYIICVCLLYTPLVGYTSSLVSSSHVFCHIHYLVCSTYTWFAIHTIICMLNIHMFCHTHHLYAHHTLFLYTPSSC